MEKNSENLNLENQAGFSAEEKEFAEDYSKSMEKQADDLGFNVAEKKEIKDCSHNIPHRENIETAESEIPLDVVQIKFNELKPGKKIVLEKVSFLESGVKICEASDARKAEEFVKNNYPTSKNIDFSKIFFAYGDMPGGAGAVAVPLLTENGPISIICLPKKWQKAIENDDFNELGKKYYENIKVDYKTGLGGSLEEDLIEGKDLQYAKEGKIKQFPEKIRAILCIKDFNGLGKNIAAEGVNHEVTHAIHQTESALFKEYGNKMLSLDKEISDIRKAASNLLERSFSESERKTLIKEYLKSFGAYQEGFTKEEELLNNWSEYVNQRLFTEFIVSRLANKPEREMVLEMKKIWAEEYGLDSGDKNIFDKAWLKNQTCELKEKFMKNPARETYKEWFIYSDFNNEIMRGDANYMANVPHFAKSRLSYDMATDNYILKQPLDNDIIELSRKYFKNVIAEKNIGKQHSDFTETVAYATGEREVPYAISNTEAPNYFVYTETAREISKKFIEQVKRFGVKRAIDEVIDVYTPWGIMEKVQKMGKINHS